MNDTEAAVVPPEKLARAAELCYSAVFSDICDQLGYRHQTLPPRLDRVSGDGTLIGVVRTFTTRAVDAIPERHYGGEIDFVDSLAPGQVAVGRVDAEAAAWGELFSAASMGRGAVGAVIDGLVRDVRKIQALGFPIYATGSRPTDALGRVALGAIDEPVTIGDVTVHSGDLVVADEDGVVVVPAAIAAEAVDRALEKASIERSALGLLLDGGTLGDVWETYRVL